LGRDFRQEKGEVKDCLAVVVLIRRQAQVNEKVVRVGLSDVPSIQLKGKEHEATPACNPPINLPNKPITLVPVKKQR
jgi:hypothetical protein